MFLEGQDIDVAKLPPLPTFEHVEYPPKNDGHLPPTTTNVEVQQATDACLAGNVDRAERIIQRLLCAESPPQDLQACLRGAVETRNIYIVEMLIAAGVHANQICIKTAIANESTTLLSSFLQDGWNINESEVWCVPALLAYAIRIHASESLIKWFLQNGADPNARCEMDITPLSYAVNEAHPATISLLFDHCGPGTEYRGQLLHWAALRRVPSDCELVMHLVLENCGTLINVNAIQHENDPFSYEMRKVVGLGTALHAAVKMGRTTIVSILLNKGVNVSVCNTHGETALEIARRERNGEVEEMLERAS